MSNPPSPIFSFPFGNSGTTDIPLSFITPGPGQQILWTSDGTSPTNGGVWSPGQNVLYNSWSQEDSNSISAVVFVQAITYDTIQDSYSTPVMQDYYFFCADPIISISNNVTIFCNSPKSRIFYYSGYSSAFSIMSQNSIEVGNSATLNLSPGNYVFFSTTFDGNVINKNVVDTNITNNQIIAPILSPILSIMCNSNDYKMYVYIKNKNPAYNYYYTLDGTQPNVSSTLYTSQILVSFGQTLNILTIDNFGQSTILSKFIKNILEYRLLSLLNIDKKIFGTINNPLKIKIGNFDASL